MFSKKTPQNAEPFHKMKIELCKEIPAYFDCAQHRLRPE